MAKNIQNKVNLDEQVAIIGMACRLPGARNIRQFWNNLINGIESISFFSEEELIEVGVKKHLLDNPNYIKARGIIEEADYFDAQFFGITPREAEILDPQHRIFLECSWHAFEDAGYNIEQINGKVGVFGGAGTTWYLSDIFNDPEVKKYANSTLMMTSTDKDYLTTRVSYLFNLKGASIDVQTACSTSLVAIILGFNSLLNYQNDLVLAGGVSIDIPEKHGYIYQKGGILSPDGHCRSFDAKAQGTVFSTGAGVVLLKRLSDAIRDGDNIYAVIKGGAINNDGSTKVGYTAPSVSGQMEVEVEALEMAGVSAETITYVEAHGTATQAGDPIEINAITQAFRNYTSKKQFCAIGSVKTNIGHTDIAAGVAGLIKTSLAIKNQKIPATLHFESENLEIDLKNSPFYLNTKLLDWKTEKMPLRAIVNSFGIGGTNASLVLESSPVLQSSLSRRNCHLFVLSAKTEYALKQMVLQLQEYVEQNKELNLSDAAYTLQVGRSVFNNRYFIVCHDRNELLTELQTPDFKKMINVGNNQTPSAIFMFPGQGNQYVNMGLELYIAEPVFKKWVDICCNFLEAEFNFDLKKMLYPSLYNKLNSDDSVAININTAIIAQPSIFVLEYALAKLWISWGVQPSAMIGHSIGEYVAACLSGVFTLKDALKIVMKRAQLIEQLPEGSMLAVLLSKKELTSMVQFPLEFGAINSSKLTVISGPTSHILKFETILKSKNIAYKRLSTSHAFHSEMMEPIFKPFEQSFIDINLNAPSIPFVSTVTGKWITEIETKDPFYWIKHLRQTVLFSDAIMELANEQNVFIEVGPGISLQSAVKNNFNNNFTKRIFSSLPNLNNDSSEQEQLSIALGQAWAHGLITSWSNYYDSEKRLRLSMPGYPFQRERYTAIGLNNPSTEKIPIVPVVANKNVEQWFSMPVWKRTPPLEIFACASDKEQEEYWIIFSDKYTIGAEIINQLLRQNKKTINIMIGDDFKKMDECNFIINPGKENHYNLLFEELDYIGKSSLKIIYLWSISELVEDNLDHDNIDNEEILNFYSPLFIEQILIKRNLLKNLCFTLVTNGLFDVTGENVLCPQKALIIGPCKVFAQEYPMVTMCRCIDIIFTKNRIDIKNIAERLILDTSHSTNESVIAYRNQYRWAQVFEPTILSGSTDTSSLSLRKNGVYLITGGLGGLGLVVASFLKDMVQAKLVLVYKSPIPNRNEWQDWLDTNPGNDETSKKIRAIIELESSGNEVVLYQADVSDFQTMKNIIGLVIDTFGTINGVFHSAGIAGGGIIPLKTKEIASRVMNPKVKGTLVLDALLKTINIDFFILFSSVTSIVGGPGQVDYCAANAFLDAFAHFKKSSGGVPVTSINWGRWDEVGMAAKAELNSSLINKSQNLKNKDIQPLVSFIRQEDKQEIYQINVNSQEWVINDHKLSGIPTLVGTAFFNMLYEFGKVKNSNPNNVIILKNMQFISPVMYSLNADRLLSLYITRKQDVSKFVFKSNIKSSGNKKLIGQDHFIGEIYWSDRFPTLKRKIEIMVSSMKDVTNKSVDFATEVIENKASGILEFGNRWNSANKIYTKNNDEWIAELELPVKYQEDFKKFPLHPALLDSATAFCVNYIADNGHYLPHSYQELKIYSALTPKIYSYVKNIKRSNNDQILSFDIEILNNDGEILIEVVNYALKRISTVEQLSQVNKNRKNL